MAWVTLTALNAWRQQCDYRDKLHLNGLVSIKFGIPEEDRQCPVLAFAAAYLSASAADCQRIPDA